MRQYMNVNGWLMVEVFECDVEGVVIVCYIGDKKEGDGWCRWCGLGCVCEEFNVGDGLED